MESKLEIYRKTERKYVDYNHVHTYKKGYKNTHKNEPKMVLRTFLVPEDIDIRIKGKNRKTGIDKVIKHIGREIEKCKRKNLELMPITSVDSQGKCSRTIYRNLYTNTRNLTKFEDRMIKKSISDIAINPIEDNFSDYTQKVVKINSSNFCINNQKMKEANNISNFSNRHDLYKNENISQSILPQIENNQLEIYDGYKMPLELVKEAYPELLEKKFKNVENQTKKNVQDVCVNTDCINNFVYNFKADLIDEDNSKNKKICTVQHLPKLNITPNLLTQVNQNVNIFPNRIKKDKNENESKHSYSDYKSHKSLERRLSRIEKMFKVKSNTKDTSRNNEPE